MWNVLRESVRRWRHGEPVIVVSGLPRSGTSMLMRMLAAGGVPVVTDRVRSADDDNPHGYFEDERVKGFGDGDTSWVESARGSAIKVITHLIRQLPTHHRYRVILVHRDLDEVLASQNKMLDRRGEPNPIEDPRAKELYERHLLGTRVWLASAPHIDLLELRYADVVRDPASAADRILAFLGLPLDRDRMVGAVDPSLYRNRNAEPPPARDAG